MLPLKTIRGKNQAHRENRAKKACEVLARLEQSFDLPEEFSWGLWKILHAKMVEAINIENLIEFQIVSDIAPPIVGGGGETYLKRMRDISDDDYQFYMATYRETLCGHPNDLVVVDGTPITRTAMRHLYHLSVINRFYSRLNLENTYHVEIGGGFGNLSRLLYQYNLFEKIFIVDFPAMTTIQYFFLTEFIEESDISIWNGNEYLVGNESARVCLVTADAYPNIQFPTGKKSFLSSTMAMTEISKDGQDYYLNNRNFDYLYVFGQTTSVSPPGGNHLVDLQENNNKALFKMLVEKYYPVIFQQGDYYSEFLGFKS